MLRKISKIAEREYVETVKTKMFLVTVFLVPILVVGGMFLSVHLTRKTVEGARPTKTIAVTDLSRKLYAELDRVFQNYNESNKHRQITIKALETDEPNLEEQEEKQKEAVRRGDLNAYLVIAKNLIEGEGKSYYYMKARNVIDLETFATVRNLVNTAVRNERMRLHDLSPKLLAEIRQSVAIAQIDLSTKTGEKPQEFTVILLPFFFLLVMFVGLFGTNQQMLTSVIEEKNARVMEVVLSAVTPFQLMAGKILGLSAAAFTLIIVWTTAGYGAAIYRGFTDVLTIRTGIYFVIYFIPGFLLFSSILAAIGSVCNTVKEAQSLMMPVSIIFISPMVLWFPVSQHPDGTLAVVLSFIPPITPMIMILRVAANPDLPLVQILLSLLVLAASVPAVVWASAKIFRTGILMYGKPPSLRELLRWVRYQ